MPREAANLLIAVICLIALDTGRWIDAESRPGGGGDVKFVIDGGSFCPKDRIVSGCFPSNIVGKTWQDELFGSFLQG